jgi:hypothetical protein
MFAFKCEAGEAVFLRQRLFRAGWFAEPPLFKSVPEAVGREAVNSRRLAANRNSPEFFEQIGGENW